MIRVCLGWLLASGFAAAAVISLDLSTGVPLQHRGSGWLHSLDVDTPLASELEPLHPLRVRIKPEAAIRAAARARSLGITVQMVISDAWGYHADGDWPGDGDDWTNWEKHVTLWARRGKRTGLTYEWDLWNEPDVAMFWGRSAAQYREAWAHGVLALRKEVPQALIVGPSTADNTPAKILEFLRQAQARGVLPDIVSWHELNDQTRFSIVARIEEVRRGMQAMGLPPLPIQINEYLVRERSRIPAEALAAYIQLERAGVDGVKSCWPDLDPGVDESTSPQITGLLDGEGRRRPLWWLYRAYGEVAGTAQLVGPRDGWWVMAVGERTRLRLFAGAEIADPLLTLSCRNLPKNLFHGKVSATRLPAMVAGGWLPNPLPVPVEVESIDKNQGLVLRVHDSVAGDVVIIDVVAER
jgi:hypothetical protein